MPAYSGGCHCGTVRFSLSKPEAVTQAVACNCSLCRKKGILIVRAEEDEVTVTAGEADLTNYQFGTKTASHWFCRHCGIHVMTRPRSAPHRLGINARCFDDFLAMEPEIHLIPFDGVNHPKDQRA